MERIAQWEAEARRLGMSYGNYVAAFHPHLEGKIVTEQGIAKSCKECGRVFYVDIDRHQCFCGEECRARDSRRGEKIRKVFSQEPDGRYVKQSCRICGGKFRPKDETQVTCCDLHMRQRIVQTPEEKADADLRYAGIPMPLWVIRKRDKERHRE